MSNGSRHQLATRGPASRQEERQPARPRVAAPTPVVSGPAWANGLVSLQRTAGNRATTAALSTETTLGTETIQRQGGGNDVDWLKLAREQRRQMISQAKKPFRPAVKAAKGGAKRAAAVPKGFVYGAKTGYGSLQATRPVERGGHWYREKVGPFGLAKRAVPRKLSDLSKVPASAAFFTGMLAGGTGRAAAWAPRKAYNWAKGSGPHGDGIDVSAEDLDAGAAAAQTRSAAQAERRAQHRRRRQLVPYGAPQTPGLDEDEGSESELEEGGFEEGEWDEGLDGGSELEEGEWDEEEEEEGGGGINF